MKIYHLVATELKRLTATGMAKLALVALMLVPVLYAGLYLWANNDPYGNLKDVPVALVVEDTGATVDGEQVDYGTQVEERLLDDQSVGWIVTDADTAERGVRDGTFDFILTLGPDFSTALTSAEGDAPTQAVVELTTNDTNSFLATTIAGQVAEKVRASITEQVGKEAALKLLDGFATVRANLTTAVDGAGQLADGAASASSGGQQLASGAGTANIGALQLADGLQQLQAGSAALPGQANQLNDGAQQLSTGLQQLQAGSASLPDDTQRLNDGAQQVAAGNAQLASTASGLAGQVQDAVDQAAAVRSDAEAAIAASALTPAEKQALLADIAQIATAVDDGNTKVQAANTQIGQLAAGSAAVAAGTQQLADAAPTLTNGIASAATGASQLAAGTQQLADAAPTLTNGIASAATGASQLAGGVTQLAQGSLDLAGGLGSLDSGADQLHDGLASGLADVPDQTADQRETAAQTISDPVAVDSSAVTKASNYGAGMAPFFISLAAWIGIYALFLIVKPLSRRALTALKKPFTATTAGWAAPALLGSVQMLAVFGIITLALGYQVEHPWGMLGFMVLTSATFATIILALNILLGSVGQFLGLVLMVLQLVTAGGTFPWQTLPGPLQVLHQVLPMSHAVDGIRQLMYGGDVSLAGADTGALAFWLLGALLVSYLGARRMTRHRTLRDLRPSLIG
ncbi:YhgE/Pip domain-containing protein [Herbiconiux sp. CPCC 205716]|uniref:YhgE/Pip domain-containing protein n=1 Tax=Herbiconiux gentiana TaxID=2970912 RepID=A0ABT2GDH3_9MICO|nr:YhgE/Pip domain-containing protein [Herbiconiux gentiana]MCS5714243.1 YhgE/Pip domain-containing protein [Herbiconiux gentiana]